jgi:hypothetical protein
MYQLYCQICNWKKITDGGDIKNLTEVKTSNIQREIPKFDKKEKKTILSKDKIRKKRFKCPNCGRVVFPKKIDDPQADIDAIREKAIYEKETLEVNLEILEQQENRRRKYEEDRTDGCKGGSE